MGPSANQKLVLDGLHDFRGELVQTGAASDDTVVERMHARPEVFRDLRPQQGCGASHLDLHLLLSVDVELALDDLKPHVGVFGGVGPIEGDFQSLAISEVWFARHLVVGLEVQQVVWVFPCNELVMREDSPSTALYVDAFHEVLESLVFGHEDCVTHNVIVDARRVVARSGIFYVIVRHVHCVLQGSAREQLGSSHVFVTCYDAVFHCVYRVISEPAATDTDNGNTHFVRVEMTAVDDTLVIGLPSYLSDLNIGFFKVLQLLCKHLLDQSPSLISVCHWIQS